MKMKQISDSTLKITVMMEDLEERGMELSDFLIPQEKTEEFFYGVLDELDLPDTFKESGMLSFRVTPKPDKIDIFVTKSEIDQNLNFDDLADFAGLDSLDDLANMNPEDFLKTMEKTIREHSQADQEAVRHLQEVEEAEEHAGDQEEEAGKDQFIYYILVFPDLRSAVEFSHSMNYETSTSELYKLEDRYYLVILVDTEDHPENYPVYLLARMLEHAEEAAVSRSLLQEHGRLLLPVDAVEELRKVQLA
ncbi:adaptor protein MecA [Streptococcus sp. DD13]|uniref:adaptor protein MecA n=1 Tax=Streptococcus sp. DD13 TaxID=1777881 RepID=UPI00079A114F|nr:adaptor protein MecA [Streptococcus sp. DD13]KXT77601.1 Negative regulator of genetic competence MecA [Streptococcus sp. DD13]